MSGWISSLDALQRLRQAGLLEPEDALAQWAETGQLRSRARRGRFSDDGGAERDFPVEPSADEMKRANLGPWPDIPIDFWRWMNAGRAGTEAHFEAGVFATTVIYDPEIGNYSDSQHIKLFEVTFNEEDLIKLTGQAQPETEAVGSPEGRSPGARWQKQRVSDQQDQLFRFFGIASQHLPGGSHELNLTNLRARYVEWHTKEKLRSAHLARSAFEKWLTRYRDGWRNEDRRWTLSQ